MSNTSSHSRSSLRSVRSSPDWRTINLAARNALERLGRPASVPEIYEVIEKESLYCFNTPVPMHVLRTQMRRATRGVEIEHAVAEKLFELVGDEVYDTMKDSLRKPFTIGMKRIHRATDKEEIITLLTESGAGAFREIWRLLLFSAVLGYKHRRRESLANVDSGKGIDQSSFANCPAFHGLVYLMSLVDTGSTEILTASEEAENARISLFEEYANGGLAILRDELKRGHNTLEALVSFVQARTSQAGPEKADLQISI